MASLQEKQHYNRIKDLPEIKKNQEQNIWLTDDNIYKVARETFGFQGCLENESRQIDFQVVNNEELDPSSNKKDQLIETRILNYWTRNVAGQKLVIALNLGQHHWVSLIVIKQQDNSAYVRYNDSSGDPIREDIIRKLLQFFPSIQLSENLEQEQHDGHSCGAFALLNSAAVLDAEMRILSNDQFIAKFPPSKTITLADLTNAQPHHPASENSPHKDDKSPSDPHPSKKSSGKGNNDLHEIIKEAFNKAIIATMEEKEIEKVSKQDINNFIDKYYYKRSRFTKVENKIFDVLHEKYHTLALTKIDAKKRDTLVTDISHLIKNSNLIIDRPYSPSISPINTMSNIYRLVRRIAKYLLGFFDLFTDDAHNFSNTGRVFNHATILDINKPKDKDTEENNNKKETFNKKLDALNKNFTI